MRLVSDNPNPPSMTDFTRWQFTPSGDYVADCAAGRRLASRFLEWRFESGFQPALAWAVASIGKLQRPQSGLEVGFFTGIAVALQGCVSEDRPRLIPIDGGRP